MSIYFARGRGWRYDFTVRGTRYSSAEFGTKQEAEKAQFFRREEVRGLMKNGEKAKSGDLTREIISYVREYPRCLTSDVQKALKHRNQDSIYTTLGILYRKGQIDKVKGVRPARWFISPVSQPEESIQEVSVQNFVDVYIGLKAHHEELQLQNAELKTERDELILRARSLSRKPAFTTSKLSEVVDGPGREGIKSE